MPDWSWDDDDEEQWFPQAIIAHGVHEDEAYNSAAQSAADVEVSTQGEKLFCVVEETGGWASILYTSTADINETLPWSSCPGFTGLVAHYVTA